MAAPSLKGQHEIAIGNALLRVIGCDGQFNRQGIDGVEPDLIYLLSSRTIGIEITTAYYNNEQAKIEWQLARGELKSWPCDKTKIWSEPDKLIISSVQHAINDKCSKTYSGTDSVWLCIEQHAPLADVSETQQLVQSVKIPSRRPFQRIYLGGYAHAGDGGGFRVYDLLSAERGH